jgi:ATP-dependent exoDNAse (exonuclease V) beta subunit
VGLRNSHDKRFPVSIGFGSRVFVCDNLSFYADRVIKRKHTLNMKRMRPGLIGEVVEGLAAQRDAQHECFSRYKATALTDERADHAILDLYRQGVINVTRIAEVIREWDQPSFDYEELAERSAWRLFNAATYTLTLAGRVVEDTAKTAKLHRVIDALCETVH